MKNPKKKTKGQTTIKSSQPRAERSSHAVVIKMKMMARFICLNHVSACFFIVDFSCFVYLIWIFEVFRFERMNRKVKERRARLWMDFKGYKKSIFKFRNSIRFGTLLSLSFSLRFYPPPLFHSQYHHHHQSHRVVRCLLGFWLFAARCIVYRMMYKKRWTRMGNENKLQNIECAWECGRAMKAPKRANKEGKVKQTEKQTDLYTNNHVNRKLLLPYRLFFSSF